MAQRHVDILVLEGGLAGEIAAVLLARQGLRTLLFESELAARPSWPASCLLLERFLEQFGGRSCTTPAAHFQLLSGQTRIDFHGGSDLEGELRRELGEQAGPLLELLHSLAALGQQVEEVLFECSAFPAPGLRGRWRFLRHALRRRLPLAELKKPLASRLDRLPEGETRHLFVHLFSGLTLQPFAELSIADAALVWASAIRPRGVSLSGLESLLSHRLEQFHGEREPRSSVQELVCDNRRPVGIQLQNGSLCTADLYLAGGGPASPLPAGSLSTPAHPRRFHLAVEEGDISEFLAERFLLTGEPTLRVTLDREGEPCTGLVEAVHGLPADAVHERLMAFLPFCRFSVVPHVERPAQSPKTPHARPKGVFGVRSAPLPAPRLYECDRGRLLPATGFIGDILWGHALAWDALRRRRG